MTEPLPKLFDIALDEQQTLRKKRPPDLNGAAVIADFMQAVLPCKQASADVRQVRGNRHGGSDSPVELLASHKTIAEIIVAAADRRRTQFILEGKDELPVGKGLIHEVDENGGLEVGRDPEGKQFERDMREALVQKFESSFGRLWLELTRETFLNSFTSMSESPSDEEKNWLAEMIAQVVQHKSDEKAREIGKGCEFTYYFLVHTPQGMSDEEKSRQDAVFQRLKTQFPGIAFLRLYPHTRSKAMELVPYLKLHKLLNPTEEPR